MFDVSRQAVIAVDKSTRQAAKSHKKKTVAKAAHLSDDFRNFDERMAAANNKKKTKRPANGAAVAAGNDVVLAPPTFVLAPPTFQL